MASAVKLFPLILIACGGRVADDTRDDTDASDSSACTAEVPYDGVDQDCDGSDLVDVDGDMQPAVEAGGLDCDDTDPSVYVGAADAPYDGVDADCAGGDDYDQDEDGYVPDVDPQTGQAFDTPYTGPLPGGDCDDSDAQRHPGASDRPYDGVENDCDCAGEFDADRDGWLWDQSANESAFTAYLAASGCSDAGLSWEDCDDSAADVHPEQPDTWYDGVDSDCAGNDDFDQDGDGHASADFAANYAGFLPADDCNDEDIDVHPGRLEVLGDGVDLDCDGGVDTAAFSRHEADWLRIQSIEAASYQFSYFVGVAAEGWTDGTSGTTWENGTISLLELRGGGEVNSVLLPEGALYTPSGVLDMVVHDDDLLLAYGVERVGPDGPVYHLRVRAYGADLQSADPPITSTVETGLAEDVEIGVDTNGDVWAAGCGAGGLSYIQATNDGSSWTRVGQDWTTAAFGQPCVLDFSQADPVLHVQGDAGDPKPFQLFDGTNTFIDLDPGDISVDRFEDFVMGTVHADREHVGFYDRATGNTYLDDGTSLVTLLVGIEVIDLAVWPSLLDTYVAAVTEDRDGDGRRDVLLLYGDAGAWTQVTLEPDPTGVLEASGVAIALGFDVLVAVALDGPTDSEDDVRWMVVDYPVP